MVKKTSSLAWLLPLWNVALVLREAFWGLAMLAFYYYDLISNIVVLKQVWRKWPGDILIAIFLFHFALVGAAVAYQGLFRIVEAKYGPIKTSFCLFLVICVAIMMSPIMIPLVLLLDTLAFIRQVFLCTGHIVQWPGLKWLHPGYSAFFGLYQCVRAGNFVGLKWLDLEDYEDMHNLIAAAFQSLPTVILNSALFALGNKPSHGEFFSTGLFINALLASALAVLKSLVVILWKAYARRESVFAMTFSVATGKTLVAESDRPRASSSNSSGNKITSTNSRVQYLVDRYQSEGLATLGLPDAK